MISNYPSPVFYQASLPFPLALLKIQPKNNSLFCRQYLERASKRWLFFSFPAEFLWMG